MAVQTSNGLETRDASTGSVITDTVVTLPPANLTPSCWKLASDGSYLCADTATGWTAWSGSGTQLFSVAGNYSRAVVIAAASQVEVAVGTAGKNVLQTLAVPSGVAALRPAFQGQFQSWFLDGSRFLTTLASTVSVYSSSAVQQEVLTLPTLVGLVGLGIGSELPSRRIHPSVPWCWIYPVRPLSLRTTRGPRGA